METRTHRRAVLRTGVKFVYAAPIVAASLSIGISNASALDMTLKWCSCYPESWQMRWASLGSAGDMNSPDPGGTCATCQLEAREAGSTCPDEPDLVYVTATGIPECWDTWAGYPHPTCFAVRKPLCALSVISPP